MTWGDPALSAVLLGGYLALQTLSWGAMWATVGRWQQDHALPRARLPSPPPRLSICVPARDEAHQIRACLEAALAQRYPEAGSALIEVILVDDHSRDGTGEIARAIPDGRLRVIAGAELPSGWSGKNWAVHQAAEAATGELLLFVDADVILAPDAAARAVAALIQGGHALLSLFGTWRLQSFWERAAIPVIGWFIRGTIDMRAVADPARPEAFANGQFLLVDRAAYRHVGGHAAIRATVLDDVRLARLFKQHALAPGLYHAPGAFEVRLYRGLGEIVAGYTKNFYEGMDRDPRIALAALMFVFVAAVLPWGLLAGLLLRPSLLLPGLEARVGLWQGWAALVCVLPVLFRYRLERADGRSGAYAWTHPLGNLVLGWILLRSLTGVRSEWKGRTFTDGRADPDGSSGPSVDPGVPTRPKPDTDPV